MNKELKKIYNYFLNLRSHGLDSLFDSSLEWKILYIFIKRFDAINQKDSSRELNLNVENSLTEGRHNTVPYFDIFEPLLEFLRNKNLKAFERIDLQSYIKKDLIDLEWNEVLEFENKIRLFGIKNFSISSFSVHEFDEFFVSLINLTKSRDRHLYWERTVPKELSNLINKIIDNTHSELYVGDQGAQIVFDRNDDISKKVISGDPETIFWTYLRVLLSGKKKIELRYTEFDALLENEADFKFIYPPTGKN